MPPDTLASPLERSGHREPDHAAPPAPEAPGREKQRLPTETSSGPGAEDWFDAVPKVEIHLHLEGAIPRAALTELARKYGAAEDLARRVAPLARHDPRRVGSSLGGHATLRELDDFTFVAESVARDLASQRIRYAEVFCPPPELEGRDLPLRAALGAIRKGLARVPAVEVRLILGLVSDHGPARAARALEEAADLRHEGVIGIGLGGSEASPPPEAFASVFERARALGLRTTAHAGERAGAASVWAALRVLRVDRIGHGTRVQEDDALLVHLAQTRLPLEMCPLSSVRSGWLPELAAHPIRMLFDRGLRVTVNSDTPQLWGTSLAGEYRELCRVHGFKPLEIRSLIEDAVLSCWLDPDSKARLLTSIWRDPGWTPP